MMTHTPGPWEIELVAPSYNVGYRFHIWPGGRGGWMIAAITNASKSSEDSRCEANARLIAAAPDLLEAAEAALVTLEDEYGANYCECQPDSPGHPVSTCEGCKLRAAIAKAKGETL